MPMKWCTSLRVREKKSLQTGQQGTSSLQSSCMLLIMSLPISTIAERESTRNQAVERAMLMLQRQITTSLCKSALIQTLISISQSQTIGLIGRLSRFSFLASQDWNSILILVGMASDRFWRTLSIRSHLKKSQLRTAACASRLQRISAERIQSTSTYSPSDSLKKRDFSCSEQAGPPSSPTTPPVDSFPRTGKQIK